MAKQTEWVKFRDKCKCHFKDIHLHRCVPQPKGHPVSMTEIRGCRVNRCPRLHRKAQ